MVEFETIKAEEVKFGNNNFIEIARKKAITPRGENIFISISRGYFLPDGNRKFKVALSVPDDEEIKKFISNHLLEI
jgi:hypothetical protein